MVYREWEDDRLIELAKANNRQAFDEIVRRYQDGLQRYAARMLRGDQVLAAELTVEAFVRLWERRKAFKTCEKLGGWLYRTTHRLVLDTLSSATTTGVLDEDLVGEQIVWKIVEQRSQAAAAQEAVSQLSVPLRAVFILSVYEEMSYEEIAAILEVSIGTVKSRIVRGRDALRKILASRLEQQSVRQLVPRAAK